MGFLNDDTGLPALLEGETWYVGRIYERPKYTDTAEGTLRSQEYSVVSPGDLYYSLGKEAVAIIAAERLKRKRVVPRALWGFKTEEYEVVEGRINGFAYVEDFTDKGVFDAALKALETRGMFASDEEDKAREDAAAQYEKDRQDFLRTYGGEYPPKSLNR